MDELNLDLTPEEISFLESALAEHQLDLYTENLLNDGDQEALQASIDLIDVVLNDLNESDNILNSSLLKQVAGIDDAFSNSANTAVNSVQREMPNHIPFGLYPNMNLLGQNDLAFPLLTQGAYHANTFQTQQGITQEAHTMSVGNGENSSHTEPHDGMKTAKSEETLGVKPLIGNGDEGPGAHHDGEDNPWETGVVTRETTRGRGRGRGRPRCTGKQLPNIRGRRRGQKGVSLKGTSLTVLRSDPSNSKLVLQSAKRPAETTENSNSRPQKVARYNTLQIFEATKGRGAVDRQPDATRTIFTRSKNVKITEEALMAEPVPAEPIPGPSGMQRVRKTKRVEKGDFGIPPYAMRLRSANKPVRPIQRVGTKYQQRRDNRYSDRVTLLRGAVAAADVATVASLVASGVDPYCSDANGITPLHVACDMGRLDLVRVLLSMAPQGQGETLVAPPTAAASVPSVPASLRADCGPSTSTDTDSYVTRPSTSTSTASCHRLSRDPPTTPKR